MQTLSHKMQRLQAWNQPHVRARKIARADAERLAAPAPIYPNELAPGTPTGEWIGGCVNGVTMIYRLDAPMPTRRGIRPRCDQRRVMRDGQQISPAMGITDAMDKLRAEFARAMPRRAIAGIQERYTERDEADAAAA